MSTKAKRAKIDKYPIRELVVNGEVQQTRMGTTEEWRPWFESAWHSYLDKLNFVDRFAPHPFEIDDFRSDPKIWRLLCSLGYVHNDRPMTRKELWAASDSYRERLEMGEAPYSSNLITTEWLVPQQQN